MSARPVSQAIVDWLQNNPGQHTAGEIASALGHANKSAGYRSVCRAVSRLDEDQVVAAVWLNGRTKAFSYQQQLKPAAARVRPSVLHRHKSASALGLIPAPVGRDRSAERASAAPARFQTVEQFLAEGGKVEHVQGFEAVRPHLTRPAWRNAA